MTQPIIEHEFREKKFYFYEAPNSAALVTEIFSDNYKVLEKVEFRPGDVVLDIGACEGMFSIMVSKLFPFVRVVSMEACPRTFFQMVRNIGLNGVTNIEAHNIGAGKKTERITFSMCQDNHSGGGSAIMTFDPLLHTKIEVDVIGLDEAFNRFHIDRCRLLKIDVEGMEYDILYNSTMLPRVDWLTGEFHLNAKLDYDGRRPDGLANWCSNQTKITFIEACKMAE
jgi:FkbM family methyltransferase